jgi:hypothetical protein
VIPQTQWAQGVLKACRASSLVQERGADASICSIMDETLAEEVIAGWLQPYLLVSTMLCHAVGRAPFCALMVATDLKFVWTTWHGGDDEGDPMSPSGAVEFLTRSMPRADGCGNRLIDPSLAWSMMDCVLKALRHTRLPPGRRDEFSDAYRYLRGDEYRAEARRVMAEALVQQHDTWQVCLEQLLQVEMGGVADANRPALWLAWAQVAPVMAPGCGSWVSDMGYTVLQGLGLARYEKNLEALRSLPEASRSLVQRELKRLKLAQKLAWQLERESTSTQQIRNRLMGTHRLIQALEPEDT